MKRLKPLALQRNIELIFESFRPVTAEIDEVKLFFRAYESDREWYQV